MNKKILIAVIIAIIAFLGIYFFYQISGNLVKKVKYDIQASQLEYDSDYDLNLYQELRINSFLVNADELVIKLNEINQAAESVVLEVRYEEDSQEVILGRAVEKKIDVNLDGDKDISIELKEVDSEWNVELIVKVI